MSVAIAEYIEKIKGSDDFFYKAKLLEFLNREKQIRVKDLSKLLAIKSSYLCHIMRLNKLPELVIDGYYGKLISISHLFIISRLKDRDNMLKAYEKILKQNLNVFQTEALVRDLLYGIKSDGKYLARDEIEKIKQLIKVRQTYADLEVIQSRTKSRIILEIKGSLGKTTPLIKELLKKMIECF